MLSYYLVLPEPALDIALLQVDDYDQVDYSTKYVELKSIQNQIDDIDNQSHHPSPRLETP